MEKRVVKNDTDSNEHYAVVPGAGANSNIGLIGGVVGGVVFCCLLVAVVVFLVVRSKKNSSGGGGGSTSSASNNTYVSGDYGSESTELKPRAPVYGEVPKAGENGTQQWGGSTGGGTQPVNVGIYGASPLAMQSQGYAASSTGSYSGYPNPNQE